MPLGETIGRAYVQILADGQGFSEDVRRQMRESRPAFTDEGEKSSKAFHEGWQAENKKQARKDGESFLSALERGRGRYKAVGELLGGDLMEGLRAELIKAFPDQIGETIGRNLSEGLASGRIDASDLIDRLRNIRAEVNRAGEDIAKLKGTAFDELARSVDQYSDSLHKSRTERHRLITDLHDLVSSMPRAVAQTEEFRNRLTDMIGKLRGGTGRLKRFENAVGSVRGALDKGANAMGKMFGRGSRNDFLNFVGGFVSLLPRALAGLTGFVQGAGGLLVKLKEKFDAAGGGIQAMIEIIGGLAKTGIPGLIIIATGVAIAINTLFASLGIASSAISMVTGAVLALAGSLAFALAGALGVVAGALVPFAAALGVAVIAFAGMDKKSKPFKELKKDWRDLQQTTQKSLFGKDMGGLKAIGNVLKSLKPAIKPVAEAMHGLLGELAKETGSEQFKKNMEGLGKALAPMVTSIGHIAGNIATFFGEAFTALEPHINDFLDWMEKVTQAWVDFGKPGKGGGKSPLAKFFDDAVGSAKKVWGLIKTIGKILLALFDAGKGSGDTLFADLQGAAEKLLKWIQDNPDKVKQWFEDARKFAEKLGGAIEAVGLMIAKMDTPLNRQILNLILDIFTKSVTFIGDASLKLDEFNGKLVTTADNWGKVGEKLNNLPTGERIMKGGPIEAIQVGIEKLRNVDWSFLGKPGKEVFPNFFKGLGGPGSGIDKLKTDLGILKGKLEEFPGLGVLLADAFNSLTGPGSVFDKMKTKASEAVTGIGTTLGNFFTVTIPGWFDSLGKVNDEFWSGLSKPVDEAVTAIEGAFTDLWNWLVGNSLIPDLVNEIVRLFGTLPGLVLTALGDLGATFGTWVAGVPGRISGVIGTIAGAFSGLAQKAITRAGSLASTFATWVAGLPGKARTTASTIVTAFGGLAGKIITKAGSIASSFASWVASLAGKARSTAVSVITAFGGLANKMIARAGSIASAFGSWLASLPGKARGIATQIANAFSGLANKAISKAGSIVAAMGRWASGVGARAGRVADDIVGAFRGLAHRIVEAIGTIIPKIKMPNIARPVVEAIVKKPGAAGFITSGPQFRLIGEAGPEAVVPLSRPLSRVDPAVRMLSAIAQGKTPGLASGGVSPGKVIDVGGINIYTPTEDPRAVAAEVIANMALAAYI